MPVTPSRLMLLYWGRRGALSRFTLELARVATSTSGVQASVSVSRQNEAFDDFASLGSALFAADRTDAVVALMPHVWSQLVIDVVRRAGARYTTVVHDAEPHQGERGLILHRWLLREEVVLAHIEASQSGVAAAAFGAGLPVVALPVGGLVEQVTHGETGLVAARPDLDALVDAITQLADDPDLLRHLRAGVARTHGERSMTRFLDTLVTIASPDTISEQLSA